MRRWGKLGYLAGAILDAIPLLEILLNECSTQNLHTEPVRLFINCEFFLAELAVLSYFSYHVTFPLLYCVEISDQTKLCEILPKLHKDLLDNKTDTLAEFTLPRHQYQVKPLTTDLEKLLLKKICKGAADGVEMQGSREYFKDTVNDNPRATRICDLTADELEWVPTNNLVCKRDFIWQPGQECEVA